MGYSTWYEIKNVVGDGAALAAWLIIERGIDDDNMNGKEPINWYEHEDDIAAAMIAVGATSVDLHGEGEDQGDVWDTEFRIDSNDKVAVKTFRCKLVRDTEPS